MPWLLAGLLVVALPMVAQAASIAIVPSYVQSFDSALAPLGALPNNGAATPVGGYLQIEFRMTLAGAAADEDFWTAIFNVTPGPGLGNASGWMDPATAQGNGYYAVAPSLAQFDSNGAALGGVQSHWQFGNADFGINPNDLQSIIVEAAAVEAANRQYGESARPAAGDIDALGWPTLIGTLVVQRTALVPTDIAVSPIAGSPWGMYVGNAAGAGTPIAQPGTSFTGGTIQVGVPEPSTSLLALIAIAPLRAWQRRGRLPLQASKRRSGIGHFESKSQLSLSAIDAVESDLSEANHRYTQLHWSKPWPRSTIVSA